MDLKERYEFCKKIESYAKMVAVCLAEQMKVEQQIACERVLEHLGVVIEMMLEETSALARLDLGFRARSMPHGAPLA